MNVAGMYTVELIENLFQILTLDTLTGVTNGETQVVVGIPRFQVYVKRFFLFTVFHSIIQQIVDYILEMNLIHIDG